MLVFGVLLKLIKIRGEKDDEAYFFSFAVEDKQLRDLLKDQAKNKHCPFEFVDMSVKEPWDRQWKTNCRSRIKGGMVLFRLSQIILKAQKVKFGK